MAGVWKTVLRWEEISTDQPLKFNNIRRDIDRARAQAQVENNKESLMRKIFNGPLRFIFDCRIRHTKNHDQSEVEWKVKIIKIP